ncbi:MAG: hypothetical protein ACOY7J_08560, partial [Pseudomonadota bacterium]
LAFLQRALYGRLELGFGSRHFHRIGRVCRIALEEAEINEHRRLVLILLNAGHCGYFRNLVFGERSAPGQYGNGNGGNSPHCYFG